jgi:transcriptional regulator
MGIDNPRSERQKGSAELLVLAQLEGRARHGYEIAKQIEEKSDGIVGFQVASLYPVLNRLESRGWVTGKWVEKEGQRRRRYYSLTPSGRKVLAGQRKEWSEFIGALARTAGLDHA